MQQPRDGNRAPSSLILEKKAQVSMLDTKAGRVWASMGSDAAQHHALSHPKSGLVRLIQLQANMAGHT